MQLWQPLSVACHAWHGGILFRNTAIFLVRSTDGHHHRQYSHGQVFVATASEKMMSLPRGFGLCTYSDSIDGLARHHP